MRSKRLLLPLVAFAATLAYLALPGGREAEPPVAEAERIDRPGGRRAPEVVPDHYVVVFRRSVESPSRETAIRERRQGFRARFVYSRAVKGFSAKLSAKQIERLAADPEVASVTPDRRVKAVAALASGEPTPPPGVRRIQAATTTTTREASGANVAVLDTGVDLDHPDLNAASGKNCVNSGAPADDDNGHGTHVAGTIAGENDGAGVVGVAPATKVYSAKVLDAAGAARCRR